MSWVVRNIARMRSPHLLFVIFLLSLLLSHVSVYSLSPFFRADLVSLQGSSYLTQNFSWMSQRLDHFTPQDERVFEQRYFEYLEFFDAPSGPVFLKICGESACRGIVNDYSAVLARKFNAAVVSLEHRYYGESLPFVDLTTDNLTYLTTYQALFDLASFRNYYQDLLRTRFNSSELENPWFVFGISYAGALSAWFQLKFPHLSRGSLASSGVVQAIFNFTAFDEQVSRSAGPACSDALMEITALVEKGLMENATAVKSMFGAEQLTIDGDFMYFLADAAAIAIQYGNPDILCDPLVAGKLLGQDLLKLYAEYVKEYFINSFGVSIDTYDQEHLKDTEAGINSDRQWWYQVCNELAYFQVAPGNNSIRSRLVDAKYHLDLCTNVFQNGMYPAVDTTNIYYGGVRITGSKIFFTNGSQDPWRHASKQFSSPGEPSWLIACHNCGHGTDLRGCPQSPLQIEGNASSCTDPDAVYKAREAIISHIQSCLAEDNCKGGHCSM
ncbi:hypothetical protein KP509_35G050000 [Ceratopteris richardii]|uniref:Serine carboxypeptidase S28 family protein n=1 Tax=Ceratopteris richardii TaxID=49495 RepID=A0A8T2QGW2_CERRI|nr:hypothetical protein KP509_35G050000 [Ceratopteris richardii]